MAVTDLLPAAGADTELHIDRFGLSIGRVSVGLPVRCTNDMVLLRYVDLVALIEKDSGASFSRPDTDIASLAATIHVSPESLRARLQTLAG